MANYFGRENKTLNFEEISLFGLNGPARIRTGDLHRVKVAFTSELIAARLQALKKLVRKFVFKGCGIHSRG